MRWDVEEGVLEKVYKPDDPNDWSGILWPGNATEPPTGVPRCGWHGELCEKPKRSSALIYGVLIAILTVFICGLAISFMQYRYFLEFQDFNCFFFNKIKIHYHKVCAIGNIVQSFRFLMHVQNISHVSMACTVLN